ncbi:MAG: nitroreductase family deazaflavin-dependent oxidoreductase [Thermoleophilia bacterium]
MHDHRSARAAGVLGRAGGRLLRNRLLVRAPLWVYRARLGFLFGSRMLLLEHTGRRTGAVRRAVLEVIGHPDPGTYVVASGFGERAQWYRNVLADPQVRVAVSRHGPAPATARALPAQEAAAVLAAYGTHHPRSWRAFRPILENTLGAGIDDRGAALPLVALHLSRTQP